MPNDLSTEDLELSAKEIAVIIIKACEAKLGRPLKTGGCPAFRDPDEWRLMGEQYGHHSELVILHDGGDLAMFCDVKYGVAAYYQALKAALDEIGMYVEQCTAWYSAVYRE